MKISDIFSSITIDDSSEWLANEPGRLVIRTIGTRTLELTTVEQISIDVDIVAVNGVRYLKEHLS